MKPGNRQIIVWKGANSCEDVISSRDERMKWYTTSFLHLRKDFLFDYIFLLL
ncbi:hypothetical protein J2S00_001028 [Caldalkalibacillus uzonensis]|uniref:Uncharacterized protein n=1 Tax=Caldalkalibacillus uzonensis TaxID=353224 RepID=A0ABU0CPA1_9BACI|nr:hypothetical protein [Caldalkalibacillus uzonensis]